MSLGIRTRAVPGALQRRQGKRGVAGHAIRGRAKGGDRVGLVVPTYRWRRVIKFTHVEKVEGTCDETPGGRARVQDTGRFRLEFGTGVASAIQM